MVQVVQVEAITTGYRMLVIGDDAMPSVTTGYQKYICWSLSGYGDGNAHCCIGYKCGYCWRCNQIKYQRVVQYFMAYTNCLLEQMLQIVLVIVLLVKVQTSFYWWKRLGHTTNEIFLLDQHDRWTKKNISDSTIGLAKLIKYK